MNSQYQLCFYSGSLTGKIFPIEKEETKIGRDASCDIVLTENSISRVHVFLYVQQNGSVVLVDNNSTNGTVVNNFPISAPVQLSENDVIGLGGEVMLVFQKAAGFGSGYQWNGTDIPAGNAPDSYNFEKKQGNIMSNDNNNFQNDGAANGISSGNEQNSQDAYGFNQAYNMNFNNQNAAAQMPYGYAPNGGFNQFDANSYAGQPINNQMPPVNNPIEMNPVQTESVSVSETDSNGDQNQVNVDVSQQPAAAQPQMTYGNSYAQPMGQSQMPYGYNPYGQQPQMNFGTDPYSQQMGQQPQMNFGNDPYSQQMSQQPQMAFGADPYSQQMGQQPQMNFGADPYSQQMGQPPQMNFGADPYSQQMGQQPQMNFGTDPYSQQMGQQPQMNFGADPYSQQMGQQPQMAFGNDPYSQQMGQQPQMAFGADPYSQQMGQQPQMAFGNDPYSQQMGQQMPYGNDPYAQQQMPYGNNPYGQQQMGYGNNPYMQQQQYLGATSQDQTNDEQAAKAKKKKTIFLILGIVLALIIIFVLFLIFYVDRNRLWCDFFPFLWDANTCANYVR